MIQLMDQPTGEPSSQNPIQLAILSVCQSLEELGQPS
ncbi:hypothetical protein SLEP1_g52552 [Rubroshorea leprosula]|uniref:Uncharacterized protein n=1 Tax=Rubroshorea leprosula TaxID=152421 RepID=A0AAV5M8E1_9ROSI|nr:hypothetical protein SLEP1_g52552 [Rubroshorea leprosula]